MKFDIKNKKMWFWIGIGILILVVIGLSGWGIAMAISTDNPCTLPSNILSKEDILRGIKLAGNNPAKFKAYLLSHRDGTIHTLKLLSLWAQRAIKNKCYHKVSNELKIIITYLSKHFITPEEHCSATMGAVPVDCKNPNANICNTNGPVCESNGKHCTITDDATYTCAGNHEGYSCTTHWEKDGMRECLYYKKENKHDGTAYQYPHDRCIKTLEGKTCKCGDGPACTNCLVCISNKQCV